LRLIVDYDGEPSDLEAYVESLDPEAEVVSMGQHLEIIKQVGSPDNLDDTYNISGILGSHGIGHTRLSTESKIDLSHSQPFWVHGHPDLATVHNGHITNYHDMRSHYEQKGIKFYTHNDSEVIGIYLHSSRCSLPKPTILWPLPTRNTPFARPSLATMLCAKPMHARLNYGNDKRRRQIGARN